MNQHRQRIWIWIKQSIFDQGENNTLISFEICDITDQAIFHCEGKGKLYISFSAF